MRSRKNDIQGRRSLYDSRTREHPPSKGDSVDSVEPMDEGSSANEDDQSYHQENSRNTTNDISNRQSKSYNTSHSYIHTPESAASKQRQQNQSSKASSARKPRQAAPASQTQLSTNFDHCIGFSIIIILSIVAVFVVPQFYNNTTRRQCNFKELRAQYPSYPDAIWKKLSVGIEVILNKEINTPSVYLFLNHGTRASRALINEIAAQSSVCFDPKMRPVHMDSSDFMSPRAVKDYGYAIDQYKLKIKEGNVILIVNLNEIPVEAARALHTICDTYSPIAKDVVIFLTLTTKETQVAHPEQVAADTLEQLWGAKIEQNELDPLITRVIDQVIYLQS